MDLNGSKPTVRLLRHEPWRLWSGYQPPYRWDYSWIHDDRMHPYDNTGLFPSVKSDLSVFGPPDRSRKQRGWYLVLRRQRVCTVMTSSNHATGNDIPPELIQRILENVPAGGWIDGGAEDRPSRRSFCICGLVCRYWAAYFQRRLFVSITLRSREDLLALCAFLQTPNSRIREYLQTLNLESAPRASPWIHLLPTVLYRLFSQPQPQSKLKLISSSPGAYTAGRSIHTTISRSVPLFSARLRALTLKDLQFRNVDALLHLVWELPDLNSFTGDKLTWPPTMPLSRLYWKRRQRAPSGPGVCVELRSCSGYWPAVWLTEVRRFKFPVDLVCRLGFDDRCRLATIAGVVECSIDGIVSIFLHPNSRPSRCKRHNAG